VTREAGGGGWGVIMWWLGDAEEYWVRTSRVVDRGAYFERGGVGRRGVGVRGELGGGGGERASGD